MSREAAARGTGGKRQGTALLDANLVEASHLLPTGRCSFINKGSVVRNAKMVVGEG